MTIDALVVTAGGSVVTTVGVVVDFKVVSLKLGWTVVTNLVVLLPENSVVSSVIATVDGVESIFVIDSVEDEEMVDVLNAVMKSGVFVCVVDGLVAVKVD